MDQRGQRASEGNGCTTGHEKSKDVVRLMTLYATGERRAELTHVTTSGDQE